MRFTLHRALVCFFLLILGSAVGAELSVSQSLPGPQLRLHRGTFDARAPALASPSPALAAPAPGPYIIIQFRGPITLADRAALQQTGVDVIGYLPDYAYLTSGAPSQLAAAARVPGVYARVPFTLADKLAPALLRAIARDASTVGPVCIRAWPGQETGLAQALDANGVAPGAPLAREQLFQMAALPEVRWIEPATQPRLLNDVARVIMNVEPVWERPGLFGANQVVAVADSGLDTGVMGTLSPDFAGRIVATHVLSAGQSWDDNNGHGTHVAGSIAGAGVQSGADPNTHTYTGSFAGVAPEAKLVIQAFEASPLGEIFGLDPDYYLLFQQAYADGARIHSDSWGDYTGPISDTEASFGGYPFGSQRTDAFVWDHPDMTIFVAAGNQGKDGTPQEPFGFCLDGDGVVDADSLSSPGTAKNVITVGASENQRSSGGAATVPWLLLSFCFATEPIATDTTSDDPNGMAAFSSRGPTDDARFKPDIVAPGTNVISNRSHHPDAGALWGAHETNAHYVYSGGTSMATPLTAGAGVLARQWLVSQGLANPSAASLKAILLNTTADPAPGQYGTGATQEIPFQRPNGVAGWGRVDLDFITSPAPYAIWVDDRSAGLATGQVVTYTHLRSQPLEVLTDMLPLRVMLVWTDYPAELSASAQLVNDLDLTVVGPGGERYYGNGVTNGDRTNNVEGVVIDTPTAGLYQIRVSGFNVPMETQPYALVVGGPLGVVHRPALTVVTSASSTSALVGQTIAYTYRVTNTGTVTLMNVVGRDDKLGPITFTAAVLTPTQHATGALTYTVRTADLPGPLVNSVTVTGTDVLDPEQRVTATANAEVGVVPRASITVTRSSHVQTAHVGQTITYTYRVTNTGFVTLTQVSGEDDRLGPVLLSQTSLPPQHGATGLLTYTVRSVDLPGPLTNSVTVTGTDILDPGTQVTATATSEVRLVYQASITVVKTSNVHTAEVGQTITYTYRITNTGLSTLAEVTGEDDRLGPVFFTAAPLAPQQSVTGVLTYTVQMSDLPGPIVNTVNVTGSVDAAIVLRAFATDTATVNVRARYSLYLPIVTRSAP